jgi:hypothetical protein
MLVFVVGVITRSCSREVWLILEEARVIPSLMAAHVEDSRGKKEFGFVWEEGRWREVLSLGVS